MQREGSLLVFRARRSRERNLLAFLAGTRLEGFGALALRKRKGRVLAARLGLRLLGLQRVLFGAELLLPQLLENDLLVSDEVPALLENHGENAHRGRAGEDVGEGVEILEAADDRC